MSEQRAGLIDGRYRLEAHAGRGGMAHVWRAGDMRESGRLVALKRILPALESNAAMRELFADESRVTATFAHENIVGFERAGEHDGKPYLALEWVEGATLGELLTASGALAPGVAVRIALDVLCALTAAHTGGAHGGVRRAPVIHRDVSPGNVLVNVNGMAKLADFGLARSLAHARTRARGTAPGKLAYLPPEVLGGAPHGMRGDLYGVGVLLWESLAGRRLFEGNPREPRVARALLEESRPSLRMLRRDLPEALTTLVDVALSFDPAARFVNAGAMTAALECVSTELHLGREAVAACVREFARNRDVPTVRDRDAHAGRVPRVGDRGVPRPLRPSVSHPIGV